MIFDVTATELKGVNLGRVDKVVEYCRGKDYLEVCTRFSPLVRAKFSGD